MAVKIYITILISIVLGLGYVIGYVAWLIVGGAGYNDMLIDRFVSPTMGWIVTYWYYSTPLALSAWFLFSALCDAIGDEVDGYVPID